MVTGNLFAAYCSGWKVERQLAATHGNATACANFAKGSCCTKSGKLTELIGWLGEAGCVICELNIQLMIQHTTTHNSQKKEKGLFKRTFEPMVLLRLPIFNFEIVHIVA